MEVLTSKGQKPGTVYVFTLGPALGLECSSPFGVKLESWLRLVNKLYPNTIPYEIIHTMSPGPRGKFPYIMFDGFVI